MSGYKHATVTISQEEYRRLHEADMKKKFREFANLRSQNPDREREINALVQQLEERQRQLEQAIALNSQAQNSNRLDQELMQDMLMRNAIAYQQIAGELEYTQLSTQDSIAMLSENFTRLLQQERFNYQSGLQEVLARQDAYLQNEYIKEEAARQWLERCTGLVDFIQHQYDHERFAPDRLNRILRNLNLGERNLSDGFHEASLQFAQQSFLDLSDLQFELEQSTFLWRTEFEKTYFSILSLFSEINSTDSVNALGLQGEELPNSVDLNYWTKGEYQQLLDHCRQYAEFMNRAQEKLSMGDIERILNQIIPMIRESFESIVYEARLRALNSQLRMNIAETALQALEHHGFKLDEAGYTDSDMRSEFNAHLNCIDGTQVSIQVVPTGRENEELTNELFVITTHPYLKTEHEARLRWEELHQALNQFNLNVSRPEVLQLPAPFSQGQSEYPQALEQKFSRSER